MPEPLELQQVNHVARRTKRLEESIRFYTDVLGFRLICRPPFDFNGAWLYAAGLQIHLIEDLAMPEPQPEIKIRQNHLAFSVVDIDAMEQRLGEHGVRYRRNTIPGRLIPQIFFHDPDGWLVEIGVYWAMDI